MRNQQKHSDFKSSNFIRTIRYGICKVLLTGLIAAFATAAQADDSVPAKQLFGSAPLPAATKAASHGFYSKGCVAGAMAMPENGPDWQAMRLSRNRRWGHPDLIALLQQLASDARKDGWPGLLVGDISQPRGGPMLSGHASHQIGLDADIWLTKMPDRQFSYQEREDTSAISMLKKDSLYVDDAIWTPEHLSLLKRAASYSQVQRILVHPGIKKKLCDTAVGDRSWLKKIRPYWGHHYHFHMRIRCPKGSGGCRSQDAVPAGEGCGQNLAWWFTDEPWKPAAPGAKEKKKPEIRLSQLPAACTAVLRAPAPASAEAATLKRGQTALSYNAASVKIPVPTRRPPE